MSNDCKERTFSSTRIFTRTNCAYGIDTELLVSSDTELQTWLRTCAYCNTIKVTFKEIRIMLLTRERVRNTAGKENPVIIF